MSTISRSRRSLAIAVSSLMAVAALTACSSQEVASSGDPSFDAVVERANDEGQVVVYTLMPEVQESRMVKAFNVKYPDIRVTVVRGDSATMPSRIAAERQSGSGGADVFTFTDPTWFEHNADAVKPLDSPSAQAWPADEWIIDHKAAVSSIAPYGMIAWNTELFPDGFKTWDDLLDPSVKGKLGTRNDPSPGYIGYLRFLENQLGADYLSRLGEQDPKFYTSAVPLAQAVASGEIGVTNVSFPSIVQDLKDKGAPIEAVTPKPGYAVTFTSGVLEQATHPNAAQVYVDFLLSEEGQTAYNGEGLGSSHLGGVDGTIPLDGVEIFDPTTITPDVVREWEAKVKDVFS